MKKILSALTIVAVTMMLSCKGKPNDADLQTKVTETVKVPGVSTEVKDGVVILSGSVADAASKEAAETAAKTVDGIKGVNNTITIAAPVAEAPAPVTISADDQLTTNVAAATKDFPGVTATVKDGVISVNGEITKDKWRTLKMALDALNPKKVDAAGLKVK